MSQLNADQALQLADQNYRQGRMADAENFCRMVLSKQPDNAGALSRLGLLALAAGRPEAAQILQRALSLAPNDANSHNNLGVVLQARGQIEQAIGCFRNAIRIDPAFAQALTNLGNLLAGAGQIDEGLDMLNRAVAASPTAADIHNNLGVALQAKGRFTDAIAAHRKAIALRNNFPEAYFNLGNALRSVKQDVYAEEAYRQAIVLRPEYAEAMTNLGILLSLANRTEEAIDILRRSIQTRPSVVQAHNSLGIQYKTIGSFDEAEAAFREAIAIRPDYAEAHFNLAMLLLMTGRFEQGWNHWEWRWRAPLFPSPRRALLKPQWDGLAGNGTILVHAEQGLGDTIQFVRYLPLVRQRGLRVVFECQTELLALFRQSLTDVEVVQWTGQDFAAKLPPFDVQIPITSLPLALRVFEPEAAPSGACLSASPERIGHWDGILREMDPAWNEHVLRVGLIWAGNPMHTNDRNRSMSLAMMAELADERIQFVSLQFGPATDQALHPPAGMRLLNLPPRITDFADSAAILSRLDLVIGVDTAGLHLAGALGRPAWALLPWIPDWRWRLDRDQTPWYPSLSLYRQPAAGQWEPVIEQVARDLHQLADATQHPEPN
jgi:tetratricopeptide (TPR) repeat protein